MTQSVPLRFSILNAMIKPLSLAVSSALLAACGSTTPATQPIGTTPTTYRMPTSNTSTKATSYAHRTATNPNALLDNNSLDELEGLLEATDMKMVENNALLVQRYGNLWDRLRASFKMDESHYDPRIEAQKSWFTSRQDYLNRLTARASRYLYHTVREAERRNIPGELALLPVIESSYDPLANSNAAAVGLWQFIPSTGRIYGLNQTPTFDGRRDVIESTRAAYDFLTTLYNQFGSWELALAAYNAGPGRIQSAIDYNAARGLPTDYWSLRLPTETMNYVPRFLAVAQIVKNPASYNVYLPAIANRQHFRSVPTNVGVSLSEISSITGVEYAELRALNPGLIAGSVDMSGPNRVLIPNEVSSSADKRISGLRGNGFSSVPAYSASTNYPTVTTVTPTYTPSSFSNATSLSSAGDNLVAAQQAYTKTAAGLPNSSSELANYATNMVKNQTTAYVTPSRITSANEPPISVTEQKQIAQQMQSENTLPTTFAQVTPNNTIVQEPPLTKSEQAVIATQIQQTSPQISQVINPVDGKIKVTAIQTQQSILDAKGETKQLSYDGGMGVPTATGQVTAAPLESSLTNTSNAGTTNEPPVNTVPSTPTQTAAKPVKTKPRPKGTRSIYQVKKGDTLQSLAARMGVNWRDVAEWNQIDPSANLMAGTTLYLYNAKPAAVAEVNTADDSDDTPDSYVVQAGDTLSGIANKYDLDLAELASYNNIPTNYAVRTKQTLWLIPGKVKSVPKTTAKPTQNVAQKVIAVKSPVSKIATSNYKVQAGDGLIALADDYDISVSQLAALNDLEPSDSLQVGQTLKVPAAVSKAVTKPTIKAPKSKVLAEKADKKTTVKSAKPISSNVKSYKVKSGDSLTSLAKRYNLSPQELAKKNGLPANANLIIGQTVKLPDESDD